MKRILIASLLALMLVMAGSVSAQEATAEPTNVPVDGPVIVVNVPDSQPAPESSATSLYALVVAVVGAVGIVILVVNGVRSGKSPAQIDAEATAKINTYKDQNIVLLEKRVETLQQDYRELLKLFAAALSTGAKFTPATSDDALGDLLNKMTDGVPTTPNVQVNVNPSVEQPV